MGVILLGQFEQARVLNQRAYGADAGAGDVGEAGGIFLVYYPPRGKEPSNLTINLSDYP